MIFQKWQRMGIYEVPEIYCSIFCPVQLIYHYILVYFACS